MPVRLPPPVRFLLPGVLLALGLASLPAPAAAAGIAAGGKPGELLLVVEDEEGVRRFSAEALRDLGYDVLEAEDGAHGLRLLDVHPGVKLLFTDVVMPGMNGVELGREIRRRLPGLPVVLTSGYSHVLAQEGSHGFELLHKPYSAGQLSRILQGMPRSHSDG